MGVPDCVNQHFTKSYEHSIEKPEAVTYAVGHGSRPELSAQGRSDEQESFHPAHREYTGDPHDAQN